MGRVLQKAKANKDDREAADQVSRELDTLMKLKEERAAAERRWLSLSQSSHCSRLDHGWHNIWQPW